MCKLLRISVHCIITVHASIQAQRRFCLLRNPDIANKIDDEIIAQIRRSRFIVADFTGHRGGVYYEAGFAQGIGLEVVWTCERKEIKKLHFDVRQYNCLTWDMDELDIFREKLSFRIERAIGRGNYRVSR
jgi:hypothetical protein